MQTLENKARTNRAAMSQVGTTDVVFQTVAPDRVRALALAVGLNPDDPKDLAAARAALAAIDAVRGER